MSMSYCEVYNEKIIDLLSPHKQKEIKIQTSADKSKAVTLEGMTTLIVSEFTDFRRFFLRANKNRSVAATDCNAESSRSHAILTFTISMKIKVEDRFVSKFAKVNLIDLAGSEDNRRTNNVGQQFKESTKINLSLSVLKRVIKAVADKKLVPYRESKLTRILQDSLGGNTHVSTIHNILS